MGIIIGAILAVSIPLVSVVLWRRRLALTEKLQKEFHIFISYRVRTDKDIAKALCDALEKQTIFWDAHKRQKLHIRCFLDVKDIGDGTEWKAVFLNALNHTCLFVPIVSEAGIAPFYNRQEGDSKQDNVLVEYERALILHKEKRLNIFPVAVGGGSRGYINSNVKEKDLTPRLMDNEGKVAKFDFQEVYGLPKFSSPTCLTHSIYKTVNSILEFQAVTLNSVNDLTVNVKTKDESADLVERIMKVLQDTAWYNPNNSMCIPGAKHWCLDKMKRPIYIMVKDTDPTTVINLPNTLVLAENTFINVCTPNTSEEALLTELYSELLA